MVCRVTSERMVQKTRVLVLQTTVPITLQTFFRGQLEWLRRRGLEIHAVAAPGSSLHELADQTGVAIHSVPMTRRITILRDLVSLWRVVRLYRQISPDIVHGFTPKGGIIAMIAAVLTRIPARVYTIFGLPHMAEKGLRRWILKRSEQLSSRLAHVVFCESESIRAVVIAERICPANKVRVVPAWSLNTIRPEFGRTEHTRNLGDAVRRGLGIPRDALVLGFIGRVTRHKGVLDLVEAYRILASGFPDLHLILVGELEPPIPQGFLSFVSAHPCVHNVGFQRDVIPFLASMDIVIHPSHREGLPTVPIEAAAMELPVVATRIPGNVDVVLDGVTGILVPTRDARALASAIQVYLKDGYLRRRHGQAGRRRVLQAFAPLPAWETVHSEYARLLRERGRRADGSSCNGLPESIDVLRRGKRARVFAADMPRRLVKRGIDIAFGSVLLLVVLPAMIAISALVRLTMGPPVIFRQLRLGFHGKPFLLYKFRTMENAVDDQGILLPDEERLTGIGRLLRILSLDELPELANVVKGDMSLVGPRPLLPEYHDRYTAIQWRRHEVKPGMAGPVVAYGRNALSWEEKFRLDLWYVDNWSLWLDLRILALTLWKVLMREGVIALGHVTMPPFEGRAGRLG